MKLTEDRKVGQFEGEDGGNGSAAVDSGRTVVVGVKLDQRSRELLTWALVKVAQSGDRVIALHVLKPTFGVTPTATEGTSSLLSLVKTFDSVLAVYEGFCNLKQVDLKLKVCRGKPSRKVLVREANYNGADIIIVGTSRAHHPIRSLASVAKYCGKKLPKCVSVIAVENGKVVYKREAGSHNSLPADDHPKKRLHYRLLSNQWKVLNDITADPPGEKSNQLDRSCSQKSSSLRKRDKLVNNFLSCSKNSNNYCTEVVEMPPTDYSVDNSLALVPIQTSEVIELKSGWRFLRWVFLHNRQSSDRSPLRMSMFQWRLRLPSWHLSAVVYPDQKQTNSDAVEDKLFSLDGESGAIVPVGTGSDTSPPSSYNSSNSLPRELEGFHEKYSSTCRLFSYQELLIATSYFMLGNMVGKGGTSQVYKGCLPDGKEVAVKILKPSEDVLKDFVLEVEILTTLHHKNIVSLSGFCFENNYLILVFDFLSRGSLEENLHGHRKDGTEFGWEERYKVALGVAEALDYLHNDSAESVIHRDVKSSNILLSDDFEPQLSDFGLASWASSSSSHMTCSDIAGTFGYLAPEYFMFGKVNDKIDVYAFGVVLLELLSGRMPISSKCLKGQENLVMWARPILKDGKLSDLLDPCLDNNYDNDQIERMVLSANLCTRRAPQLRPKISLVVKLLQGDEEVVEWARKQGGNSLEEVEDDSDSIPFSPIPSNIQSHLNLALLDLEDDSVSISSTEQHVSLEAYLQGRYSRESSFDE